MFDKEEYKKVINVPLSVIIGSFIIIVITTGMTDPNGLKALIGGYSGLLFGILFIIILNYPPTSWLDMVPFIVVMILISLLIFFDTLSVHLPSK
jgi:membrane associated rhomboid family serine protease